MQFAITGHGHHIALVVVIVSSLVLLAETGDFRKLVRFGDAAIEPYDRAVGDWVRNTLERLNPTFPRCF